MKKIITALTFLAIGFTSVSFANCPSIDKVKDVGDHFSLVDGVKWTKNDYIEGKVRRFLSVTIDERRRVFCVYETEDGDKHSVRGYSKIPFELLQPNWDGLPGTNSYRCGLYPKKENNKYIKKYRTVDECNFKVKNKEDI